MFSTDKGESVGTCVSQVIKMIRDMPQTFQAGLLFSEM